MRAERFPSQIDVASGDLSIWRWQVEDEPLLSAAITQSIEHLRPWMEWIVHEPVAPPERRALIQRWTEAWEAGVEAAYGVFAPVRRARPSSAGVASTGGPPVGPTSSRSATGSTSTTSVGELRRPSVRR